MKEKLLNAYGMINDKFIEESLKKKQEKKRYKPLRWGVAAAIILGLFFSVGYQVNAKFHEWVVSIVHMKEKDIIQEEKSSSSQSKKETKIDEIQISEVKNIDDVFDTQYVTAKHYVEAYKDIYIANENGKEGYYYIENNRFEAIKKTEEMECKIQWKNYKGFVRVNIISYNGKQYVRNLDTINHKVNIKNKYVFDLSADDNNVFWLTMSANSNTESYSYPLKYEVDTKKIIDVFRKVKIKNKSLQTYNIVTNWEKISDQYCSVLVGNTHKEAKYYMIDVKNQKAISIEKMTKIRDIQFLRGVEQCMVFGTISSEVSEEYYDYYCYNPSTKACERIYHNIKIWGEENTETENIDTKVAFSGGRYDLMAQKGVTYLMDELTGGRIKIDGLDQALVDGTVMINNKGDKLLISSSYSETGISKVGVLDIVKSKLYVFERENLTRYEEFSIGWSDSHTVVIQAGNEENSRSAMYLYGIK